MGVYIKGMEMPTSCSICDIKVRCFEDVKNIEWLTYHPAFYEERLTNCPLVQVPPHGRLIDADALEEEAQKRILICDKNDNQFQKLYEIMRAITLAPTIIPAEEDE